MFSDNAFEFGLLGNTFVRFIRALDAIQPFVALGWKQLRYFIHADALASETSDTVRILDRLADLEPMFAQMALREGKSGRLANTKRIKPSADWTSFAPRLVPLSARSLPLLRAFVGTRLHRAYHWLSPVPPRRGPASVAHRLTGASSDPASNLGPAFACAAL
jgi:hypothetical protein